MEMIKRITTIILLIASICVYAQQSSIKVHKDKIMTEHPSKMLVDLTAHNQISAESFEHRNVNVIHQVGTIQLKKSQLKSYPSLLKGRSIHNGQAQFMMMPSTETSTFFARSGSQLSNQRVGMTQFSADKGSFSNDIFSSNDFVNSTVMAKAGDTPPLPGDPGAPLGDIFIPFILLIGVYFFSKKK